MNSKKRKHQTSYSAKVNSIVLFSKLNGKPLKEKEITICRMILRMEYHPSPDIFPYFSNAHVAKKLDITERHVMRLTSKLKSLGIIRRIQCSRSKYVWETLDLPTLKKPTENPKRGVTFLSKKPPQNTPKKSVKNVTPIYINNIYKKETNCETQSSSSSFSEEKAKQILKHKLPEDERSNEEFLNNVKHHINHNSRKTYHVHARFVGVITILKRLYDSGELFQSSGYVGPDVINRRREERKRREEEADRAYEERIASYQKPKSEGSQNQPAGITKRFKERMAEYYRLQDNNPANIHTAG